MKKAGAIRHKLKQAAYRHLKRRLEAELRPHPDNCVHNQLLHHPKIISQGGSPTGICVCPDQEPADRLCDIAWGGIGRAQKCPLFLAPTDKDSIKDSFRDFLASAALPQIAAEYPDLAALLWVLEDEAPNREVEIEESDDFQDEDSDTDEDVPPVTFDLGGVVVQVKDPEDLVKVQDHLASQEEQVAEATEAVAGHREFAEAALRDKEVAQEAVLAKQNEVVDLISRIEALEGRLAQATPKPSLPAPIAPTGFWERLRWLFGGTA